MDDEAFLSDEERDALRVLLMKMGQVMARHRRDLAKTKNFQSLLQASADEVLGWVDNLPLEEAKANAGAHPEKR